MKRAKAKPVKAWGHMDPKTNTLRLVFYYSENVALHYSTPWLSVVPVTITEGHPPPAKRRKKP